MKKEERGSLMDKNGKVNILIVDDHSENLVAMSYLLDSEDYNLILASSGEEALKCLLTTEVALILLDVKMPGMDGFETARYLRNREKTRFIPIIFITAYGRDEQLMFDGYASGAVDYIFKPENPIILKSKVEVFVELYKKNRALRQAEEKVRSIFENAVEGIFQASLEGRYLSANPALARILKYDGVENLIQKANVPDLYVQEGHYAEMLRLLNENKVIMDFESQLRCADGSNIWVCENVRAIFSEGQMTGYEGFLMDITGRKISGDQLKKREKQLAAAQQIVGLGSWELDIHSNEVTWSKELASLFGISSEKEVMSHPDFIGLIYPLDRQFVDQKIRSVLTTGQPCDFEFRLLQSNGDLRTIHAHVDHFSDSSGIVNRLIGTAQDVTARRKSEEEIKRSREQFRALSAHLQGVREDERTKIAREIHDELGQMLTAIKLDVAVMQKDFVNIKPKSISESLNQNAASIHSMIDSAINSVRHISAELRPVYLDLGVIEAIEWQSQEFQNRTGIECKFRSQTNDLDLDKETSTVMFRILQEALTNVARHSEAKAVRIDLKRENGSFVLRVSDNGKGIQDSELLDPKSFGLLGMKERIGYVNGELKILGKPKKGTTVIAKVPVPSI
jgi:PAS domain S-box-containing protein